MVRAGRTGRRKDRAGDFKKLKDAREEGKVARSQELNSAAMLIALFLSLRIFVSYLGEGFISVFHLFYGMIPDVVDTQRDGMTVQAASGLFEPGLSANCSVWQPLFWRQALWLPL